MRKNVVVIWLLAAAAMAALPGCPGKDGDNPLDVTCEPGDLATVSFENSCDVGPKLDAVLHATASISDLAEQMATDVKTACDNIVTDLGGTPPAATDDLAASTQASCDAARTAIADAINQALPVGASLAIEVIPGECTVDLDVAGECKASCDATVDYQPGTVECDPGSVTGTCSGVCEGECRAGCEGGCSGHCSAECTGTCDANCNGTCDGTCSVVGANGQCAGTCDGTCTGSCSGSCSGSCTGSCDLGCSGSCTGECHGGCDVEYTEPHCEGTPPSLNADADCEASCNAQASVEATCTDPEVTVTATIDGADQAKLDDLIATLTENLPPLFLAIARSTGDLAGMIQDYGEAVTSVAGGITDCGLKAASCATVAAQASVDAYAEVNASVSVSVEVSASASVSAQ